MRLGNHAKKDKFAFSKRAHEDDSLSSHLLCCELQASSINICLARKLPFALMMESAFMSRGEEGRKNKKETFGSHQLAI